MNRIYMDNGATAFPKAPGVSDAMKQFIDEIGCNVGRGAYEEAFVAQRVIWEVRERLNRLLDGPDPSQVILTMNITQSMNMLIKGLLKSGDHVLISPLEHNAVLRPLHQLAKQGISYDFMPADAIGRVNLSEAEALVKNNTKLVIQNHASNVFGTVNDIEAIGHWAKSKGLWYVVDVAQTAGVLPISMKNAKADAVAFTGHKGLLGPQGVGGFMITTELAKETESLITGGTGSHSESEVQPEILPDKFESGTPNTVGLFGLRAALEYVENKGIDQIYKREIELTKRFMTGLEGTEGLRIIGPDKDTLRTPVVSLDFPELDNAEVSYYLEKNYGIATRVGMHCAPSAHKHLGTFPQGTVRFSFSSFNTTEEIDLAVKAIKELITLL